MIPILVGRTCIGYVKGQVFHKNVVASKHMLRKPPAWAFDVDTLDQAEEAGAKWVQLRDVEGGREYVVPIATIRARGFLVTRGHGRQVALGLGHWQLQREGGLEQMEMFG